MAIPQTWLSSKPNFPPDSRPICKPPKMLWQRWKVSKRSKLRTATRSSSFISIICPLRRSVYKWPLIGYAKSPMRNQLLLLCKIITATVRQIGCERDGVVPCEETKWRNSFSDRRKTTFYSRTPKNVCSLCDTDDCKAACSKPSKDIKCPKKPSNEIGQILKKLVEFFNHFFARFAWNFELFFLQKNSQKPSLDSPSVLVLELNRNFSFWNKHFFFHCFLSCQ